MKLLDVVALFVFLLGSNSVSRIGLVVRQVLELDCQSVVVVSYFDGICNIGHHVAYRI